MSRRARPVGIAALLLVLAACAASESPARRPAADATPAPAPALALVPVAPLDASFDYRGLIVAPFGTLLKESPVPLHEVLLFHDATHGATDAGTRVDTETKVDAASKVNTDFKPDNDGSAGDCFAVGAPPPRFVGQLPDQFLLCFDHDRLRRIEATVQLNADQAAATFTRACTLWLKTSAPMAPIGNLCEGSADGVNFSARLTPSAGESSVPLSMTLESAPPDAVHAP